MVTTFNLFTSIAWSIAGLISIINSIVFLMKNPKKRLNQLFSSGFICWSLSLFFNGITFAVAYRSMTAANIFRDLGVIIGILGVFLLLLATFGIHYGAETLRWYHILIVFAIYVPLVVLGVLNDWVTIDGLGGYKTTDNWLGKSMVQIVPTGIILIGIIMLILTYFKVENKLAKKRIGFFITGISSIITGMLMFVLDSMFSASDYLFPSLAIIAWVTGPILTLAGFYVKLETRPKPFPEQGVGSKTLDPKQKLERPS
ncbi:MAG: hypothetical protein FK733_16555 [Asgard group archaeon]|nr:hypothetical protein [Asgard group archaeon]